MGNPPPRKFGAYRIEELVGTDSFGLLYKAHDESLDRVAAIKVLPQNFSERESLSQQVRKNMQALAQVNHPRIPKVYSFGKEGEHHYVALEWCSGGSLASYIRKCGRLSLEEATKILRQCVEGLSAAWKVGIVHGNLKPHIIMLDENHDVKVTGFGLSPLNSKDLDLSHASGSLNFLAPELDNREDIDFRADIYSLGIIFHYMLLSTLPARDPVNDDSGFFLPVGVQQVVARMTHEDPLERYQTYDQVLQAIINLQRRPFAAAPSVSIPRAVDLKNNAVQKRETLFELLADLYKNAAHGVLKLSWHSLQKQFLVRRGEIVFFESTQQNESLENLLITNRWIDSSAGTKNPEDLIRRALENRQCTMAQFGESYRRVMKQALMEIFQWQVIQAEFIPCRIENEPFVSFRLSDVLLEASRSIVDVEWVRKQIPKNCLIRKTLDFEQLLIAFALSPEESFLAYRFEGDDVKPEMLSVLTGLPEDKILRTTVLLNKIGAVELRSESAVPRKQPSRPPAQQIVTPPPVLKVDPTPPPKPPEPVLPAPPPPAKMTFQQALKPPPVSAPVVADNKELDLKRAMRDAEMCFSKAEEEYESKNFGKTAFFCKEALNHHEDARYWHLLGISYAQHPRFQRDAEEALHKASRLAPADADYHAILAAFYFQRNLLIRARTHCEKALELAAAHKTANTIYQKVLDQKPGKGDCWCVSGDI